MTSSGTTRQRLRDLKALEGPFDPVDFSAVGDSPQALFLDWLDEAIAAGIAEPHAMTLSTVDAEGHPDARMLILKNVDDRGWHFAISAASPKGRQIEANPAVALTFYWQNLGRQVRIRGRAVALDAAECAQDFLARSVDARAMCYWNGRARRWTPRPRSCLPSPMRRPASPPHPIGWRKLGGPMRSCPRWSSSGRARPTGSTTGWFFDGTRRMQIGTRNCSGPDA